MPNTSASGGPLQPTNAAPLDDAALVDYLQAWIVGILGGRIPGTLFFPRWQPDPPNLPTFGTDWASIGITVTPLQLFPQVIHRDGYDETHEHEWIDITLSFYGPNAFAISRQLRGSLYVRQNLDPIYAQGIKLTETGTLRSVPPLTKERWLYRVDFSVKLRREIVRVFAIENIEAADITVNNEFYTFPVDVNRAPGITYETEGVDRVVAVAQVISTGSMAIVENSDTVAAH